MCVCVSLCVYVCIHICANIHHAYMEKIFKNNTYLSYMQCMILFRHLNFYLFIFKILFLYFERNRESVSRGGTEREGERKSQAASMIQHRAGHRARAHKDEIMTWAKIRSRILNWLSHPGVPVIFLKKRIRFTTHTIALKTKHIPEMPFMCTHWQHLLWFTWW